MNLVHCFAEIKFIANELNSKYFEPSLPIELNDEHQLTLVHNEVHLNYTIYTKKEYYEEMRNHRHFFLKLLLHLK